MIGNSEMILDELDLDFCDTIPSGFRLRDYQSACLKAVADTWKTNGRVLVVMATGTGKGSLVAEWASRAVKEGKRLLFLAHRDKLVKQTALRIMDQGGVGADVEMGPNFASLTASVVCASVQTMAQTKRLLGFPADHFHYVIMDECHHSMASTFIKVLRYFHFGPASLDPDWVQPLPNAHYDECCKLVGLTATPDAAGGKELGDFFTEMAYNYDLVRAIDDGWLVRPVSKSIPVEIDLRGLMAKRTSHGKDISDSDLQDRLSPVLEALAKQIAEHASDRKTVAFVPSVECARILAGYINATGLRGIWVSGSCPDVNQKLDAFERAGTGTVICNAQLITEGVDIPSVDCVAMFRATQSRTYYSQAVGRATRPLKGLVDGLATAAERRAAIAASSKPNCLILDPLWIHDRLNLVSPYDLVCSDARVLAGLKSNPRKEEGGDGALDLLASARDARDLLASLEKEAVSHRRKRAVTIDPIALAVSMGDDIITSYAPNDPWEKEPPTPGQLRVLRQFGVDAQSIKHKGLASRLMHRVLEREQKGFCSPKDIKNLASLGVDPHKAARMSKYEAKAVIEKLALELN